MGDATARARRAGQILIEAIGAEGPEGVDKTAERAVARIEALEACMVRAGLRAFLRDRPPEEIAEHLEHVIESYHAAAAKAEASAAAWALRAAALEGALRDFVEWEKTYSGTDPDMEECGEECDLCPVVARASALLSAPCSSCGGTGGVACCGTATAFRCTDCCHHPVHDVGECEVCAKEAEQHASCPPAPGDGVREALERLWLDGRASFGAVGHGDAFLRSMDAAVSAALSSLPAPPSGLDAGLERAETLLRQVYVSGRMEGERPVVPTLEAESRVVALALPALLAAFTGAGE